MIKTILVPTDFSIEAQELFHCVEQLKMAGLKKIVVLHVVDFMAAGGLTPTFVDNGKEELEKYKKYIQEKGIIAETIIKEGNISQTIVNVAKQKNVDCIVMGSTTGGIIKSWLLGSTTEYVVRKSQTMVLVEKYNYVQKSGCVTCKKMCSMVFDKIFVPIDFSEESMRAVEKLKLLKGSGKHLLLTHVIEKAKDNNELKKLKEDALTKLKKIGSKLKDFKLSYYVTKGIPSNEIKKLAIEEDITLIALTNKGAGKIKDILLGSTTENLLRTSTKPIIVIPVKIR